MEQKFKYCACCGERLRMVYDCNEICKNCGWEDDDIQNDDPTFEGGANEMSLNEAREAYKQGKPIY